jgi:tetratricopeptide (TPR) repeat protein
VVLSRGVIGVALAGLALASARRAAAEGTTTASASGDAARRDAGDHARRGVALYKLGRFLEAIDEFEQAYVLFPSDALLYNLGQSHRQLDHCKEALEYYRKFLDGSPESSLAPKVRALVPELEKACAVKRARPVDVDNGAAAPAASSPAPGGGMIAAAAPARGPETSPPAATGPATPMASAEVAATPMQPLPSTIGADGGVAAEGGYHLRAALGAGVLASGGASIAPVGPVVTVTRELAQPRLEVGGRLSLGLFAGDPGQSGSALELLAVGGRAIRRGTTTLRVDGGAGVVVLSGLPRALAAGERSIRGSFAVPELAAMAGVERDLDGAWALAVGAELSVGPSSALRGGASVAAVLEIGIGYRR